jgi:hypothetical protein
MGLMERHAFLLCVYFIRGIVDQKLQGIEAKIYDMSIRARAAALMSSLRRCGKTDEGTSTCAVPALTSPLRLILISLIFMHLPLTEVYNGFP